MSQSVSFVSRYGSRVAGPLSLMILSEPLEQLDALRLWTLLRITQPCPVARGRESARPPRRPCLELLEQRLVLTNISGQWQGAITQNPNGSLPTNFTVVAMNLTQTANNVQGTELLEVTAEPQYFVDFDLSGTINQATNILILNETTITDDNQPPQWTWIGTSYSTTVSASGNSISGTWPNGGTEEGTINLTLVPSPTLTALSTSTVTAVTGQSVTFTATVSNPSPGGAIPNGGTVTFSDQNGLLDSEPLENGVATFTSSSLPPGTNAVTASYGGTAGFAPSTTGTAVTVTVNPAPTPAWMEYGNENVLGTGTYPSDPKAGATLRRPCTERGDESQLDPRSWLAIQSWYRRFSGDGPNVRGTGADGISRWVLGILSTTQRPGCVELELRQSGPSRPTCDHADAGNRGG